MTVEKMSISLVRTLSSAIREAAEESDETLSGWIADAAQRKLRAQALDDFLADWESENGPFTEEELARAARRLDAADSGPSGQRFMFKVIFPGGKSDAVVATIATIIDKGHPIFVLDEDFSDALERASAIEGTSAETAIVPVRLLNK